MRCRVICVMALAASILLAAGCSKTKTIPDDRLGDIFRDIYMTNAYAQSEKEINFDSTDIYLPILQRYGYDTDDFLNTLAGFSKRKSAKLSNIVDDAVNKLTRSADSLGRKVATLDHIDSLAFDLSKEVVYRDSLIEIRSMADSAKMTLKIPVTEGRYGISYYYTLDSLDQNNILYNRHYIKDSQKNLSNSSTRLRKEGRVYYTLRLESPAEADTLEIIFGDYPRKPKRMHLTIDSLQIEHFPPREEALERLIRTQLDYRFIVNGKESHEYFNLPADSSTLHIRPPEAAPQADTLSLE